MKTEKIKQNKSPAERSPDSDIETHSYNNPKDLMGMVSQEADTLRLAKLKISQQAARLDIVEEGGHRYAIITNLQDNKVIYKTKNPTAIEYLFEKAD